MEGKVVYDYSKSGKQSYGDPGKIEEESSGGNGKFPSCLPKKWKKGFPNGFKNGNSIELGCTCGRHVLYATRIPREIWPENWIERIRVFEKATV